MDITASKDIRTHLCFLKWGYRLLPCKLLWKTRKSVLQAVLQDEGGQRAPSQMIWVVIVAGLEVTHGKVVWSAGHPQKMLQKTPSNLISPDTQHSRFFYRYCLAIRQKCWKFHECQWALDKMCVYSSRRTIQLIILYWSFVKLATQQKPPAKLSNVVNSLEFSFWITKIQTRILPEASWRSSKKLHK